MMAWFMTLAVRCHGEIVPWVREYRKRRNTGENMVISFLDMLSLRWQSDIHVDISENRC